MLNIYVKTTIIATIALDKINNNKTKWQQQETEQQ